MEIWVQICLVGEGRGGRIRRRGRRNRVNSFESMQNKICGWMKKSKELESTNESCDYMNINRACHKPVRLDLKISHQ